MDGYSQPDGQPHDDSDNQSSIYSRPSIVNSPGCPSVRLPSPGPSVRTLNESDGGRFHDDILSLANFSCGDMESSDRGSVFTANTSTSPSSSRPSTPSSCSHDQHPPPLNENTGETGRQRPLIRSDKRPGQPVSPHLILSSRKATIGSTSEFTHDSSHPGVSLVIHDFNKELPRRSVLTDIIPVSGFTNGDAGGRNEYSSEAHQTVISLNVTVTSCHACDLPMKGVYVRALGTTFHLQCFTCIDCGEVVASKFFPIDDVNERQQPLCERDYFRRLNLICAKCGMALRGSYMTACNKKYHIEHFTCSICPTLFGAQDSYYEHDNDVYCHYHYSTRFSTKCPGCNTAVLKQFVEMNSNTRDECWHPECYMINKFWGVKVTPHRPGGFVDSSYAEEERQESRESLKEKQTKMEQQVYRIWTVLSAYEESSAASISDTLRHVSKGLYLEAVRMAERTVLHVEVLLATIDDLEWHFDRLGVKGMPHVRESRLLCKKMVELFVLLSNTQGSGARRLGMTQALLKLVTGIAHYLKVLIRIALTGALKLGREHGIGEALQSFLDKLHRLSVESGNPSARRMKTGGDDLPLARRLPSINTSTYGVTYGFRSLAPEIAGESPFLDASQNSAPINVNDPSTPSDACVACTLTIEEDCVRLGTYQRWHSHCLRCNTCWKYATSVATDKTLVKAGRGAGDGGMAPAMKTKRRPPTNVDLFVYWLPATSSDSEAPTTIYCTDCAGHTFLACRGGFQAVSRLEQYAFLLNVALRRLHLLLKKKNFIAPMPIITTSFSSGETKNPYHSSQDTTRIGMVRHARMLSETSRLPKRSTIVESSRSKVVHSNDENASEGNPSKNLPPEPTPADIPRFREAVNAVKHIRELPSVPTLEEPKLADISQLASAAQATEQRPSMPPQTPAPYVAELTPLELAIVRHAAVAVLYRSSLRDEMDLDRVLETFEVKRPRFWEKLFKGGNDRKKKGLFGVRLELLVERDGVDSSHGASSTVLRVPRFIDNLISAMRQIDVAVNLRKTGSVRRPKELIAALDRTPNSVDFTRESPGEVASLLKLFLCDLPEPLLTFKLQRLFIAAAGLPNDEERKRLLHMLTLVLPKSHRDTLEVLLVFLKWVSLLANAQDDVGTRSDLADFVNVISRDILFPGGQVHAGAGDTVKKLSAGTKAVKELLANQDQFLVVPEEFLPLLHDQEVFTGSMELSSKDFLKQCEMYMRIKFGGAAAGSVRIRGTIAETQR